MIRGINLNVFSRGYLGFDRSHAQLDAMKAAGVTWVAVVPNWYMPTKESNQIRRHHDTPTDASLRTFIREAHERGIRVLLKPHVDVETGDWRGEITPANDAAWFNNYKRMITGYARLAQQEGVEALVIGVEFNTMQDRTLRWRQVISAVRRAYDGQITYAANWNGYDGVQFWDDLDWIGIDAYFPLAGGNRNPRVAGMTQRLRGHLDAVEDWRTQQGHPVSRKPVVITEVGYTSVDGGSQSPSHYPDSCAEPGVVVDMNEQRDAYTALFRAISERPWLAGVFLWWWDNPSTSDHYPHGDDWECFYTPRGKPAMRVIINAYRRP
ncbi:MAG: hypothetical protein GEU28_00345 [Dehalococcoidia bacterium]|nr:hypothetical protein [Dehalococcoidia bacterium]